MIVKLNRKPTYKEIVLHLLRTGQGPRDHDLMIEIMSEGPALDDYERPSDWAAAFKRFMYDQKWTLGALMAYVSWHSLSLDGTVIMREFLSVWNEAFQIIVKQDLIERRVIDIDEDPAEVPPVVAAVSVGGFIE